MANEVGNDVLTTTADATITGNVGETTMQVEAGQSNEPTAAELLEQLNLARAENEKLKSQYNKVSSEAADWRKKLNAKLTEDEKKTLAATEAQEALKSELQGLREIVAIQKATERYMGLGMDKDFAKATAEFEVSGDNESVTNNIQQYMANAMKQAKNEWLANRPPVNAGNGEEQKTEDDPFIKGFNNPTIL